MTMRGVACMVDGIFRRSSDRSVLCVDAVYSVDLVHGVAVYSVDV